MKKMLLGLMIVMLAGCGRNEPQSDGMQAWRDRCAGEASAFSAQITADYIDSRESFSMDCVYEPEGLLRFTVTQPPELAGITGTVSGEQGTLRFEETVLALPLLAEESLSPVSGPWVMMKALGTGPLRCTAREEALLHISVDDSYREEALEVEAWLEGEQLRQAEISWKGRRNLLLQIENFKFVEKQPKAA